MQCGVVGQQALIGCMQAEPWYNKLALNWISIFLLHYIAID